MRRFVILCGAVLALAAPTAKAGFVPVFVSATPAADTTVFIYTLNFTTNPAGTETLATGDFITLYDIGPVISFTVPTGIVATQAAFAPTAPQTGPVDTSILNLTFTYNGALGTIATDTTFVNVTFVTGLTPTRLGEYTSIDTIPTGKNSQIGNVILPVPVPEPSSLALSGLGLAGVLGMLARRRLRVAHA